MSKVKIYEKGLDEYPKSGIIIANLLMACSGLELGVEV